MVDHLRDERVRLAEQHQFLSQVLHVSPSGVVDPRLRRRVSSLNPAAERLLDRPGADGGRPAPRDARTRRSRERSPRSRPASRAWSACSARGACKCHRGTFVDRGFPRSFLLIEELTEELRQFERAAYEKLIRVMSHEVNNTVAASNSLLHSSLTYAGELDAGEPPRLRAGARHRDRAHRAAEHASCSRFADVFRLPAPLPRSRATWLPILERHRAAAQRRRRTPPGSPGGGSWTQPAVRGGDRSRRRSSRRSSTSSRTPSRRSTATARSRSGVTSAARPHDAGDRGQRPGHDAGSAGEPVHAVLQHQAARPGHRPDAGPGDPRPATASTTPSSARPRARRGSRSSWDRRSGPCRARELRAGMIHLP